jgi:hypothetical protein
MKVEFKDTFFESIEKIIWYDSKLWKVWEFIRRGIPTFITNVWRFRKELYAHQWWDYQYALEMLYRSLTIMVTNLEQFGIEEDISRMKKVNAIKRALELLKNKLDDNYVDRAELKLGKVNWSPIEFELNENGLYTLTDNDTPADKAHIKKIFQYASKLENTEWKELWNIIGGNQNINEYKKILKSKTSEELMEHKVWGEWFNGSDMRGWWD